MNSLIGLGAATSFTAGTASLLLPGAGLEIGFLEEPVMLLAFVLLGRALETRARLKAAGTSTRLPASWPWSSPSLVNIAGYTLKFLHVECSSLVLFFLACFLFTFCGCSAHLSPGWLQRL